MLNLANQVIIKIIEIYQKFLSPDHSFWAKAIGKYHCKYHPTCSMYAKECFEKFGFFRAVRLTVWRLLRCNPWSKGGIDLVPDKK